MPEPKESLTVKCPHCGKTVHWTADNVHKPFCCERCKLIDLGAWANEENAIPGDPASIDSETDHQPLLH